MKTEKTQAQLLLHTCCADCLLKALSGLKGKGLKNAGITVFFSNSNIHPRSEWIARLEAVKEIAEAQKLKLIIDDWSPKSWFKAIREKQTKPQRCERCWEMRLMRTVEKAKELGITKYSTTLLSSHYQDRERICEIGKKLGRKEIEFVEFEIGENCCKTEGFYKQNYCGCCFSLVERYREKF